MSHRGLRQHAVLGGVLRGRRRSARRDRVRAVAQRHLEPGLVGHRRLGIEPRRTSSTKARRLPKRSTSSLFGFLLGDFHPHVMALPFTILAIVHVSAACSPAPPGVRPDRAGWGKLVVAGMLVGALYPLRLVFDFPTYLVLLVLAIAITGGWNGARWRKLPS
ncbi:MAG: DUF2298 domain-containing protein [Thermomicrobiales bacterium]